MTQHFDLLLRGGWVIDPASGQDGIADVAIAGGRIAMARKVLAAGIRPTKLGADMHGYNVRVPDASDSAERAANPFFGAAPFSLTHAMSELLALGVKLPEIVATVTGNPARTLGLSDSIGARAIGREADSPLAPARLAA